jgi:hypothetical protein
VALPFRPPHLRVGAVVANALAAAERSAAGPGAVRLAVKGGGLAFYTRNRPPLKTLALSLHHPAAGKIVPVG